MNTAETYKIRKQQRSLHLLLKPEIANLCEILHLPVCSWFLFVMFYLPFVCPALLIVLQFIYQFFY